VLEREDPVFSEARFNPVPVRFVIDREGRVEHIHFLSAFPEQAKSISDALSQWRFKPYVLDGQAVEVETGLLFGRPSRQGTSALR
jgi:Gram-negative bacterial TonB protein C-terminal